MTGRGPGGTVVVAGGYGKVGGLVARRLAPMFPDRVVVAGRDGALAGIVAAQAGHGARAEPLDVTAVDTHAVLLEPAAVVVSCVAQPDTGFVRTCLGGGVHYVDITADEDRITAIERLDALAHDAGAVGVLSVGLAPGLTNLLGHHVCSLLESVDRLDLGVQLGLADAHGKAALAWTLDNMVTPYTVIRNGASESTVPFRRTRVLDFGARRAVVASSFNFPEQRTLARTLDVATVSSWLALQPRAAHTLAAALVRLGVTGPFRPWPIYGALLAALGRLRTGSVPCAVSAQAMGHHKGGLTRVSASIAGHGEANVTAQVAVSVTERVLAGSEAAGVHHIEELSDPNSLLADIIRPEPGEVNRYQPRLRATRWV